MKRYRIRINSLLAILTLFLFLSSAATGTDYRAPDSVEGATTISAEQAKALYDQGLVFIDVRNPRLYARRHIPGGHHLDLMNSFTKESLEAVVGYEEPLVIYCSGVKCSRSSRSTAFAVSWGFKRVHYFRGGIVDWKKAGYPVETSDP